MSNRPLPRLARLNLAVAALFLIAAFVPIKSGYTGYLFGPAPADAACNSFRVYEDPGSGGSDGNDSWANCADNATFVGDTQGLLLGCNGGFAVPNNDWNDCISKLSWSVTGTTEACVWTDANYTGQGLRILPGTSNTIDLGSPWNDAVSSVEIAISNCSAPGPQFAEGESDRQIIAEVGNGRVTFLAP